MTCHDAFVHPDTLKSQLEHIEWRRHQPVIVQLLDRFILYPWVRLHHFPTSDGIVVSSPREYEDHVKLLTKPHDVHKGGDAAVEGAEQSGSRLVPLRPFYGNTLVRSFLLAAGLLNAAFAYTNYVTTRRPSCFRGVHGGYRDVLTVNAMLPLMVSWGMQPMGPYLWGQAGAHSAWLSLAFNTTQGGGDWMATANTDSSMRNAAAEDGAGLVWPTFEALRPCINMIMGLLLGTHITYLVRSGFCDKSISAVEVANASLWGFLGILFRMGVILYFVVQHVIWMVDQGVFFFRMPLYGAVVSLIFAISRSVRERYYFHWHHWAAGIMLFPFALTHSPGMSVFLQGLLLAQVADGAARWSCAPLWHLHQYCGLGKSLI